MTYEIQIEGTPKTWNAFINKTHWAYVAYKNEIKRSIRIAILRRGDLRKYPAMSKVLISFVCGYSTQRRSDIDSLCVKGHVDALVREGIITDDNRFVVQEVRTTWEESKTPFTKIIIEEL